MLNPSFQVQLLNLFLSSILEVIIYIKESLGTHLIRKMYGKLVLLFLIICLCSDARDKPMYLYLNKIFM